MTPRFVDSLPHGWVADAACRGLSAAAKELFFPAAGESGHEAKAICASCVVRPDCLDWAIRMDERDGIWGGLTAPERRKVRHGSDVQVTQCWFCKGMFPFAGMCAPSFRKPNFCSEVCKMEDRRKKKNESRARRKLGITSNGVVR